MRTKDIALTGFFISAVLFLYLPEFINGSDTPKAPSSAVASVSVIKGISDEAAVVRINDMRPTVMSTMKGEATIRAGSEIYINVPEDLRRQMRIDAGSFGAQRCIEIRPAKYGWVIVNVYTNYKCND